MTTSACYHRSRNRARVFAILLAGTCLALPVRADFELDFFTIDGGGAMLTTGGDFELSGTIGQPDANAVVLTGGGFELVGGFWGVAPGPAAPCRGDFNCDGSIDFADIDPFVAVLSGGACCDPTGANCDVNADGAVNFGDIDPFVALLSSGATCP